MPQVARAFGVECATVFTALRDYATPLVEEPACVDGVTALAVDETACLSANAAHHTVFVTRVVDPHAPRLLDVVPGAAGTPCPRGWPPRATAGAVTVRSTGSGGCRAAAPTTSAERPAACSSGTPL